MFVSRKISMHSLYVWARPEKKRKNIDPMHGLYVFTSEGGGGGLKRND